MNVAPRDSGPAAFLALRRIVSHYTHHCVAFVHGETGGMWHVVLSSNRHIEAVEPTANGQTFLRDKVDEYHAAFQRRHAKWFYKKQKPFEDKYHEEHQRYLTQYEKYETDVQTWSLKQSRLLAGPGPQTTYNSPRPPSPTCPTRYFAPGKPVYNPPKLSKNDISPRNCEPTTPCHTFGRLELGKFTPELLDKERRANMGNYALGRGLVKELLQESLAMAVQVPPLQLPSGKRNVGAGARHSLVAGARHQQVSGGQGEEDVEMEEA